MNSTVRAAGLCWYNRKSYARIRAVMSDADVLPDTYSQWLKQAEAGEKRLAAQGWIIHRIDLDPDTFLAWCTIRNVDANADARIRFANEAVAFLHRDQR